jgi:hypothetical protein
MPSRLYGVNPEDHNCYMTMTLVLRLSVNNHHVIIDTNCKYINLKNGIILCGIPFYTMLTKVDQFLAVSRKRTPINEWWLDQINDTWCKWCWLKFSNPSWTNSVYTYQQLPQTQKKKQ